LVCDIIQRHSISFRILALLTPVVVRDGEMRWLGLNYWIKELLGQIRSSLSVDAWLLELVCWANVNKVVKRHRSIFTMFQEQPNCKYSWLRCLEIQHSVDSIFLWAYINQNLVNISAQSSNPELYIQTNRDLVFTSQWYTSHVLPSIMIDLSSQSLRLILFMWRHWYRDVTDNVTSLIT
jgi:hypothetical protein